MHNLANVLQTLDYHEETVQFPQNVIRVDANVVNLQFQARIKLILVKFMIVIYLLQWV